LIFSAASSSIELECVFFSTTPNSGNRSMILFGLTSSSRASSLMRIFFIYALLLYPRSGPESNRSGTSSNQHYPLSGRLSGVPPLSPESFIVSDSTAGEPDSASTGAGVAPSGGVFPPAEPAASPAGSHVSGCSNWP